MRGVHYSSEHIAAGSIVFSHADQFQTYQIVWKKFKEVADENGIFLPEKFGYAYPVDHVQRTHRFLYEVEAPNERVTRGNYNHSIPMTMSNLRNFKGGLGMPLAEQLLVRDENLRLEAKKYFMLDEYSDVKNIHIELISDSWIML